MTPNSQLFFPGYYLFMESSEGSPGSDAIYHSVQPFPQTFQSRCLEIWYQTYGFKYRSTKGLQQRFTGRNPKMESTFPDSQYFIPLSSFRINIFSYFSYFIFGVFLMVYICVHSLFHQIQPIKMFRISSGSLLG